MFFTFVGESLKWSINQEICYFLLFVMIVGNKWSKTLLVKLCKLSKVDLLLPTCCSMQGSFIAVIMMHT